MHIFPVPKPYAFAFLSYFIIMKQHSKYYSATFKHGVCLYYKQHLPDSSFRSVSKLFSIDPTGKTLSRWYSQWNGTISSLQPKPKTGRPTILSRKQMERYIGDMVVSRNRVSHPISYRTILSHVRSKTKKDISITTVKRYGRELLGIKAKTVKKRTLHESEYTIIYVSFICCPLSLY